MPLNKLFIKAQQKKKNIEDEIILDPQQKEAVLTSSNKVLVVAGAGSGKTRILTERIKHLLNKGVKPSSIVAITFTNMASEEMKARLQNVPQIGDVFIGTIHSFANKVMKNTDENYTIYSSEIEQGFYKELIDKYCKFLTFEKYLKYAELVNAYQEGLVSSVQVQNFLSSTEKAEFCLITGLDSPNVDSIKEKDYKENLDDLKAKYNVITFDQLLTRATNYFKNLNTEMEHLLVDEFQDIGTLESRFFKSLAPKNYFYVGDDWQSIYGFKGGNVNIMKALSKNKSFNVIKVSNNYRNAPKILEIAEIVKNQIDDRIEKEVIPISTKEGGVYIDNKNKIGSILDMIKDEESEHLNEWFILVRTNKQLTEVQNMLDDRRIRNHTFRREGLSLATLNKIMQFNSVKVLTVHTAKGLENKNVILYGNFPLEEPKYRRNNEERKVMYVGVTRAEENLIILN